jgi:predicted RNase H-like HicB family nuclease
MTSYIALLYKEQTSDYGVSFPDFPGCITAGQTLEEARKLAAEALAFHIDGMREDGDPIPAPSSLDSIMADPENANAVAFLVDIPNATPSVVRVNVTFPAYDLRRIDAFAENHGMTRSGFLADAARRAIDANGLPPPRS